MNIEQERQTFEAWHEETFGWSPKYFDEIGVYSATAQERWLSYQAGRAALQSQKPEPNDLMLSGVLRMPFELAMADPLSRMQYYKRAQQALNELEALQSQDREDAERYRYLITKLQQAYDGDYFETDLMRLYCHMPSQYKGERVVRAEITWSDKVDEPIGLSEAIDHARRIEENE